MLDAILRFREEQIKADDLGPGGLQALHDLCEPLATPGPASQLGNAAVVDDDKDHRCARRGRTPEVKSEVECLGLQITHQGRWRTAPVEHRETERA
jgi:hypothetical protein